MSFSALLLRLHLLVILAFLIFYATKAALLFLGRREALRDLRARTRIVDFGLGLLILGSGGWLLMQYLEAVPGWLRIELGLMLGLLPLANAAMRRQYKPGVALTLLGFLYGYGVAEAGSLTLRHPMPRATSSAVPSRLKTTANPASAQPARRFGRAEAEAATLVAASFLPKPDDKARLAAGKVLFTKNCAVCHGANGRLGLNGAHDLTKSNLNTAGRTYLVTQGLGKMPSFKTKLTPSQIQQVVVYSLTLQ